jgi:pimeloyl-ACP methyl ester carboxylesterase
MKINANGVHIEVEDSHAGADVQGRSRPVVLLIMGLGMQLIAWPAPLVQGLVDAGYRVVRFDNRDAGLSTHFGPQGKLNLFWAMLKYRLGRPIKPPYSLQDMTLDALGVLDALQIESAHVVGASMGGMIAQRLALSAPGRVLSLVSLMSSSGARGLPEARREVVQVMLSRPLDKSAEAAIDYSVRVFKTVGGPAFPSSDAQLRERVTAAVRRSLDPDGVVRQMLAVMADTGRAAELAKITAPTLVLHGKSDPLVPFACGEDTARRISGAKLAGIEGMGHDFPPSVVALLLPLITAHLDQAGLRT